MATVNSINITKQRGIHSVHAPAQLGLRLVVSAEIELARRVAGNPNRLAYCACAKAVRLAQRVTHQNGGQVSLVVQLISCVALTQYVVRRRSREFATMPPTLRICRTRCDDRRAQYSVKQVPVHDDLESRRTRLLAFMPRLRASACKRPKMWSGILKGAP